MVIDSYTLSSNPSIYLYPEKATVSSCCQHLQYFSSRHSLWQIKEICNASYFSAFSETWGVWFDTYIPFFGRILHMISLDAQSLAEDLCICNLLLFTTRGRFFMVEQGTDIWVEHVLLVVILMLPFFVRTVVFSLPIVSGIM